MAVFFHAKNMLQFTKLDSDFLKLNKYFEKAKVNICDLSVGVRYLWRKEFSVEYAIFNDTLILKESCSSYKDNFYFPIGKDVDGALFEIENYAKENNIPLTFCWVDNLSTANLCSKFYKTTVSNDRAWCDYIYDAESFKSFTGKKYSGQRNHINKFKKTYPNFNVKEIDNSDIERIKTLLTEYEKSNSLTEKTAIIEDESLTEFIDNIFNLEQQGLLIEVDGKCVAFSVGERVGDTLVVHVEKALIEYEGVYPFMANEFAKRFAVDGVKYINREEDCGDDGLRTSKLQYHPVEIREKNTVTMHTTFEGISFPIEIKTDRLLINELTEQDIDEYYALYIDDELNKFWGYDYREDLGDKPLTKDYFYNFQKGLKEKREEVSLAIRLDNKMIGEVVIYNFDYHGGLEIGFRLKKEMQNKGYAYESVSSVVDYIFNQMKVPIIKGKCFIENLPSKKLFEKLGFSMVAKGTKHYHFLKKL